MINLLKKSINGYKILFNYYILTNEENLEKIEHIIHLAHMVHLWAECGGVNRIMEMVG